MSPPSDSNIAVSPEKFEDLLEMAVGVSWACDLTLARIGNRNAAREVIKMIKDVASRHIGCGTASPEPSDRPLVAMVVDQEPLTLMMLEYLMREQGHTVIGVRSADEALKLFDLVEGRIDLLITGVEPDEGGLELVPRMRAIRPELCVVLTGAATAAMPNEAHLDQPICPAELASAIDQAIGAERPPAICLLRQAG